MVDGWLDGVVVVIVVVFVVVVCVMVGANLLFVLFL
jgi:hypothetical protein